MIITEPRKESAILALPEICVDANITLYPESLFQAIKVLKINILLFQIGFLPNMIHNLRPFISGYH